MPNWCSNSIEILGPREKIRALWNQARLAEEDGGGLLRGLRPEPNYNEIEVLPTFPQITGTKPVDKSQSWWDWRVQNWGTKWEVSPEGLEYEEDKDGNFDNGTAIPHARITGWFDSAWSPPCDALAYYAELNEDVRIKIDYHEPGMAFVGQAMWSNGELDLDEHIDYAGYDSKTVRDAIGSEMDDMWAISENMAEYEMDEEEE